MTPTDMTLRQRYEMLMRDAYDASEDVDDFDPDDSPAAVTEFNRLLQEEFDANEALILFCMEHGRDVLKELGEDKD